MRSATLSNAWLSSSSAPSSDCSASIECGGVLNWKTFSCGFVGAVGCGNAIFLSPLSNAADHTEQAPKILWINPWITSEQPGDILCISCSLQQPIADFRLSYLAQLLFYTVRIQERAKIIWRVSSDRIKPAEAAEGCAQ